MILEKNTSQKGLQEALSRHRISSCGKFAEIFFSNFLNEHVLLKKKVVRAYRVT